MIFNHIVGRKRFLNLQIIIETVAYVKTNTNVFDPGNCRDMFNMIGHI